MHNNYHIKDSWNIYEENGIQQSTPERTVKMRIYKNNNSLSSPHADASAGPCRRDRHQLRRPAWGAWWCRQYLHDDDQHGSGGGRRAPTNREKALWRPRGPPPQWGRFQEKRGILADHRPGQRSAWGGSSSMAFYCWCADDTYTARFDRLTLQNLQAI